MVVGDVSGKGVPAALLVAGILGVLRAESQSVGDILQLLQRVNTFVYHNTAPGTFLSMFYGILGLRDGVLSFCNAGHEHPLLLRGDHGRHELLESTGGLLGIEEHMDCAALQLALSPDDLLLVYSDGVTDTLLGDGKRLGQEGLLALGSELRKRNAPDLVEAVYARVTDLAGPNDRVDDFTQVAIKKL